MKEPQYILKNGTKIITHERLQSTQGMLVGSKHLVCRRTSQKGIIAGVVGGHGGDVYWVEHEGRPEVAVYGWQEFELAPEEEKAPSKSEDICARPDCGKRRAWHMGQGGLGICGPAKKGDTKDPAFERAMKDGGFVEKASSPSPEVSPGGE